MLIFGRSPNLVLGALTAIFNVLVVAHVGGFNPDAQTIAAINIAFGAVIGLVANDNNTAVLAGKSATDRIANNGNGKSS